MGGRKKSQTVGYRYSIGLHMVPCYGPVDSVNEIRIGDRTVFGDASTELKPNGYGIGELAINQPGMFGGDAREGGVVGTIGVLDGNSGQGVDSYLAANTGASTPAYRGVLSVIWRRLMYAANNHYLKPCAVRVTRVAQGWDNNNPWHGLPVTRYDATLNQTVFVGANPAAIIVECLTNRDWGMGYPFSAIGNFQPYKYDNEFFGLNFLWARQQKIEDFIGMVLDHIGAVLYLNPATGLFDLVPLRGDYLNTGTDDVFTLNPDVIVEMRRFERGQWGELPNEITVVYTDWDTGKEATVTVENLASIQLQGGVINQRVDYPGVTDPPLAARLALRELKSRGTPLARMSFTMLASGYVQSYYYPGLPLPGSVLRLNWPRLGVDAMYIRVIGFSQSADNPDWWEIDAVEDVFAFDNAVLAPAVPTPAPIATVPLPPALVLAFEAPYWEVARNLSRGDLAFLEDTDCYAGALAAEGGAGQINWQFRLGQTAGVLADVAEEEYAPLLTLTAALPATEADATGLALTAMSQPGRVTVGDYGYLVDVTGQWREIVQVMAFDSALATVDIARGMLDSVPVAHPAGTRLVMAGDWLAVEQTARLPGEDVYIAAQPNTVDQSGIDEPAANGNPLTLGGRLALPYPPGRVRINGLADPAAVPDGDVLIEWAHRDRTQQTAYLVRQDEGDIGPEQNTTVTLRITDNNGIVIRTVTGLTGTSYTWLATDAATDTTVLDGATFTVELESVRGAFTSLLPQQKTLDRPGYGLHYGNHYGGI